MTKKEIQTAIKIATAEHYGWKQIQKGPHKSKWRRGDILEDELPTICGLTVEVRKCIKRQVLLNIKAKLENDLWNIENLILEL